MDIGTNENLEYVSSFKRTSAISIDLAIVMFLRIVVAQLLGTFWINNTIEKFIVDFREHFGTEMIKNTPEHLDYVTSHPAFAQMLLFYFIVLLVGLFYHAYLNSSSWQATIGKRLMNIKMIKNNDARIGFSTGIAHYILSVLPIIFITYIFALMINSNLTLFHAISYSSINMFLGFAAIFWVQIHSFTKRKTTAYDLICKVVYVYGKTTAKLPWSKI